MVKRQTTRHRRPRISTFGRRVLRQDPLVAEHPVRALLWVEDAGAGVALERLAQRGRENIKCLAKVTSRKRSARMSSVQRGR